MANVKFEFNGKLTDGKLWDEDSKKKVIVELEDNDLSVPEMLEEFMNFMQAIGYKFEIGDRFEVVNDFQYSKNNKSEDKLDLSKIPVDFGNLNFKFDVSNTGMDGSSDPAYGAVPPATLNFNVEPTDNFTQEELVAEFNRLKNEGFSDSVALPKARSLLRYRDV